MGRTARRGSATVSVTGYEQTVERAQRLDEVAAGIVLERLGVVHEGARARWPVDTGRSRDGLDLVATSKGGKIVNLVPYAPYVHAAREKRRSWDLLVRTRIAQDAGKLAAFFGEAIRAYMEGRRGG